MIRAIISCLKCVYQSHHLWCWIVNNTDTCLPISKLRGVFINSEFDKNIIIINCGKIPNISCFIVPLIVLSVTLRISNPNISTFGITTSLFIILKNKLVNLFGFCDLCCVVRLSFFIDSLRKHSLLRLHLIKYLWAYEAIDIIFSGRIMDLKPIGFKNLFFNNELRPLDEWLTKKERA